MARTLLAKALQECPTSGMLWAEAIWLEPRATRKAVSTNALGKCSNDAYVITAIARLFWADGKADKARNWFNRAVKIDADNGDTWAYFLKFEMEHGTAEGREEVVRRGVEAAPRHGVAWPGVAKDVKNFGKGTAELLKIAAVQM